MLGSLILYLKGMRTTMFQLSGFLAISGVISPLIRFISVVTLLIAPLITTHEPPSRGSGFMSDFGLEWTRL